MKPSTLASDTSEGRPNAAAVSAEGGAGEDEGQAREPRSVGLEREVLDMIKTCYDPEIPVNIYELGLIYRVHTTDEGEVTIDMTLTSPACPVAGSLPPEVEDKVASIPGVTKARVNIVWDPPWVPEMMTEAAKLELNIGW